MKLVRIIKSSQNARERIKGAQRIHKICMANNTLRHDFHKMCWLSAWIMFPVLKASTHTHKKSCKRDTMPRALCIDGKAIGICIYRATDMQGVIATSHNVLHAFSQVVQLEKLRILALEWYNSAYDAFFKTPSTVSIMLRNVYRQNVC